MAEQTHKAFSVIHIKAYIPIILDMSKMNYDAWRELVETHCLSFSVAGHLDGTSVAANAEDTPWKERDGLVKMWIYGTISQSLLDTVLKTRCTTRELWVTIENLFRDNKEARAIQLENDLRSLTIGDLSVHDYCQKLKTLSDNLANVESPVSERSLVMHMLNGLSEKYDNIINVIKHRSPFPSFTTARSMLQMEEDRISKHPKTVVSNTANSSSPNVLYASDSSVPPNTRRDNHNQGYRGNNYRGRGRGRNNNYRGRGRQSWNHQPWNSHQQQVWYPPNSPWPRPTRNFPAPMAHLVAANPSPGLLGTAPKQPTVGSSNFTPYYPTQLPDNLAAAFGTMTMQDPNDASWYMDTGATNHLTSQPGILRSLFNTSSSPSVTVGNGSSIPTSAIGSCSFPSQTRSLHLHKVLVCPSIIKNLISVRQFTKDNHVSVEFDPFGFLVKDFLTRTPLIRCNSDGPLYSITTPSTTTTHPQVMMSSIPNATLWHRRLGHLGNTTLQSLISSGLINCSKVDMPLCHACQLEKHTRLPFTSVISTVSEPFEIIHSDVWTSPVPSISGIKYYVIYLDHFSHYVWVYPLHRKSEVFNTFLHFMAYVRNQFGCSIKSLQCDNGGEYQNRAFLDYLATHGITPRFSCPHTSQQNGKAERTLRTINNSIRSLLFQANMPATFWVEALYMAAHLFNILPSSSIGHSTPFQKLFQKPPTYIHLRIFGCLCYPNLLPTSSHKLEPRSTACIFLGYPSNHKGYRCLNLSTRKVIISRHVIFDETSFPFTIPSPSSSPPPSDPPLHPRSIIQKLLPPPPTPTPPPTDPINDPPTSSVPQNDPPPPPRHSMQTRSKAGITKPKRPISLHTELLSPLPKSYLQALEDPNWTPAMDVEYDALIKTGTWDLVPRPKTTNIVRSMWLYRHKFGPDGKLTRYKARLVANGKSQQIGIDCDETFSPVVKPATIRLVLDVALSKQWPIHQLDVKNAFLHGTLDETVYMHQPPGFVDPTRPNHVCLLRRSLYGLKQAPRTWNQRFATFAARVGFVQSKSDASLFVFNGPIGMAYLLIYVDDIALTTSSPVLRRTIISLLSAEFSMTDLGELHHFLGIAVKRNESGLFLSQHNYAADILHRANMTNCKPVSTPADTRAKLAADDGPAVSDSTLYRSLAGALQYLTFMRPDISFAVQQVCLFMHDPKEPHFNALKRIIRYIKGTLHHGLQMYPTPTSSLVAYTDADWAGCPTTRRSTSGYCVFHSNNLISWSSKRQHTVSRSSAEAEYRGVANVVAETTWIRNLLLEMHRPLSTATFVYCDNVSAVYLSTNPVQHQRTKHVEIDLHFVRERIALGQVRVHHVPSSHQYADIFTKGLPTSLFTEFRSSLNILHDDAVTAGE